MKRMSSLEEFNQLRHIISDEVAEDKPCLVICAGTGGLASGSNDTIRIVKRYILEKKLQDEIQLRITGCQGFCEMDPFIVVEPGKNLYPWIKKQDIPKIIDAAVKGEVVDNLLYKRPFSEKCYISKLEIPFFEKQRRTILGRNELVDPIRIYDYIKQDGYKALQKVLSKKDPEWIINEIKQSGLRGRGGAGFSTGKKWELARTSCPESSQKFMVCNADEGDPGAYMDRSLLEGNPHSIIEGMIIAGIAINATKGIIYVRSEYPLAIKHTLIALRQAREMGILGENILGTNINFDIEIVRGAGAFVCGEETALIHSIEGKIGEPRQRPPYPTQKGIFGYPTCINNVETLANVPVIISIGAEEYAKVGVPGNSGTKIFSLVGKISNTGLVEVPMGLTIKELIYDIGGGPIGKAKIKAVQTGGPSGGCIPASMFDLPIDYESLEKAGSIMGSGGMIVMDENTCMVDIAKYYMKFLMDESCGKCFTCRKGTQRMYEILEDISSGKGTFEQLELLEELARVVQDTTMCALGQTASNPVFSTLRYFRNEYIEHIKDKKCKAGVCKDLTGAPCQSACPVGTEAWRYVAHIQRKEFEDAYKVIREANPFPSVCARVCDHPCESRCRSGTSGGEPVSIRTLKRFVTDNVDPAVYKPKRIKKPSEKSPEVAVIGSGPSGLTAAHYLSLRGYKVTIFEAEDRPGGMLTAAIPSYRLPRQVLQKEIDSLLDENITLKCNTVLGKDITIENLFEKGFKAVFIATGAHKSTRLNLENEDVEGICAGLEFLKLFNLKNQIKAKGHVGVIGGGNSAIDSARVAKRCDGVKSVTVFYRRTKQEMPAYGEEIEAAIEEGIKIQTLVTPVKVRAENNRLTGVDFIENRLGEVDSSGRRRPVPIPGTENTVQLDTLLVAIGEKPDIESSGFDNEITDGKILKVDKDTFMTNKPGVFGGGDVVTGPNSVIEGIAAGKNAAIMIDRYLSGEKLDQPAIVALPDVYMESIDTKEQEIFDLQRVHSPKSPVNKRIKGFDEVELSISGEDAVKEAGRCLRCDLEFTEVNQEKNEKAECLETGGKA